MGTDQRKSHGCWSSGPLTLVQPKIKYTYVSLSPSLEMVVWLSVFNVSLSPQDALTNLCAATLKWKLQIKLAISLGHSILTTDRLALL